MNSTIFKIDGYGIERREDGMFNASSLVGQWNARHDIKKRLDAFLKTDTARDLMSLRTVRFVRERGEYTVGRPKETVWLDGTLFVPLCVWLSPFLYADAVTALTGEPETAFLRLTRVFGIEDTEQQERLAQCLSCAVSGDKNVLWLSLPETKRRELLRLMAEHIGDIENGTLDFESYIGILKDIYFSKQTDGSKKGADNQ